MKKKLLLGVISAATACAAAVGALTVPNQLLRSKADDTILSITFTTEHISEVGENLGMPSIELDSSTEKDSYKFIIYSFYCYGTTMKWAQDDCICELNGSAAYETYFGFSFDFIGPATLYSVVLGGKFNTSTQPVEIAGSSLTPTIDESTRQYYVFWGLDQATFIKLTSITINYTC